MFKTPEMTPQCQMAYANRLLPQGKEEKCWATHDGMGAQPALESYISLGWGYTVRSTLLIRNMILVPKQGTTNDGKVRDCS